MKIIMIVFVALTLQGCAALDNPAIKCAAEKAFDWVTGALSCDKDPCEDTSDELPPPLDEIQE